MNVVFVSHCDFEGNSAMHIFSIANELQALGVESTVAVPNDPRTVRAHGTPRFAVMHHDDALRRPLVFPDGRGPDLVHAWTPRELVRRLAEALAQRYEVPYLVHLEDNEEIIVEDELGGPSFAQLARLPLPLIDELVPAHRSHPIYYPRFLAHAAAVTALMDRLLEFKPAHVPGLVFWAGFDAAFADNEPDPTFRRRIGLSNSDLVAAYTGNVHNSNVDEARSLVVAVAALRRRGHPLVLVKTGWNQVEIPFFEEGKKQGFIVDLGFLPREDIPKLIATADVLVQPGHAGAFNDYRFPAKLPEFLASGKPVVLPKTNIGRFLQDDVNCVLLDEGHSLEIAAKLEPLLSDPERRKRIGAAGREFALRELTWSKGASRLKELYDGLLSGGVTAGEGTGREATAGPVVGETTRVTPAVVARRVVAPASANGHRWPKLIAFYLPQFHPIPENDEWWGEGFTEWTNVKRGRPNFAGHYQPLVPADLGYYDLREPEVMDQQVELARAHGIHGFCFYYYWFNGHRLLERPLEQMLARGKPDFPFCICWANENWTRRWDGSENDILMEQKYAGGFSEQFINDIIPILKDPRYIRIGNAPLLLVYRVDLLPDPRTTARLWRKICAENGIPEIHLAAVQSFGITDPRPYGFDAAVDFPPHTQRALIDPGAFEGINPGFEGYLEDYLKVAQNQVSQPPPPYIRYRGVMPAWDNTPRRGNRAHICVYSSPAAYQAWLEQMVEQTMARSTVQEPLVFLNAWNEWAEGAYLEPDSKNGRAYLEATRRGLCRGMAAHFRHSGFPVNEEMVERALVAEGIGRAERSPKMRHIPERSGPDKTESRADKLIGQAALKGAAERYRTFRVEPLSYGTVRDYCDSFDHLYGLATANGDLKDLQRPWALKAILSRVGGRGARLLEIGAGEPLVAGLLARLGHEVWIVDPYDGSGNGPRDFQRFRAEYPDLTFIRNRFSDATPNLEPHSFDCIYSISVLEHIPAAGVSGVMAGLERFLKPDGVSIHAVDHVHRGRDAAEHLANLRLIASGLGHSPDDLDRVLAALSADTDTYYLSAESYNRWRNGVPYDKFPMRVWVSIQICSPAGAIGHQDGRLSTFGQPKQGER